MKSKILLNIYVPAAKKTIEIRVDRAMHVKGLNKLLADYFRSLGNSEFIPENTAILCDSGTGEAYCEERCIGSLNLKNGSTILFI